MDSDDNNSNSKKSNTKLTKYHNYQHITTTIVKLRTQLIIEYY